MVLVNDLEKMVDEVSYHAGVAKDYSNEINDENNKECIKVLDQIISEITDNVNKLKICIEKADRIKNDFKNVN